MSKRFASQPHLLTHAVPYVSFDTHDNLLLASLLPTEASRAHLGRLLDHPLDWAAILRRANVHLTTPLLRWNLAGIGALDRLPAKFRHELDESSHTWAARHLALVSEARRLTAALDAAGITAIPLKGAALMLGGYYPGAGQRAALDLDLLVDPARIEDAEAVAASCGFRPLPGRRDVRPRQRLENERNHRWPQRGASGVVLELHHRAFHFVPGERDLSFDDIRGRAKATPDGLLLPCAADLALHLIHHTMVDLQSTHAIPRTLADLHFLFAREPQAREDTMSRARDFGFAGAARLVQEALALLAEGRLDEMADGGDLSLWLETALLDSPRALAETARVLEYLDFSRHPLRRMGDLLSLAFPSRSHLEQIYGAPGTRAPLSARDGETGRAGGIAHPSRVFLNYLRRPIDLMRRFPWASLSPGNLRRVRRLRRSALD